MKQEAGDHHVEAPVGKGDTVPRRLDQVPSGPQPRHAVQHRRGGVQAHHVRRRRLPVRKLAQEAAGSGAQIEQALVRRGAGELGGGAQRGSLQRQLQVVERCQAIPVRDRGIVAEGAAACGQPSSEAKTSSTCRQPMLIKN